MFYILKTREEIKQAEFLGSFSNAYGACFYGILVSPICRALILNLATKVFFTSPDLIVKQFSLIPRAVSKQANFIGSIIEC